MKINLVFPCYVSELCDGHASVSRWARLDPGQPSGRWPPSPNQVRGLPEGMSPADIYIQASAGVKLDWKNGEVTSPFCHNWEKWLLYKEIPQESILTVIRGWRRHIHCITKRDTKFRNLGIRLGYKILTFGLMKIYPSLTCDEFWQLWHLLFLWFWYDTYDLTSFIQTDY
jgi:hypothetical protein